MCKRKIRESALPWAWFLLAALVLGTATTAVNASLNCCVWEDDQGVIHCTQSASITQTWCNGKPVKRDFELDKKCDDQRTACTDKADESDLLCFADGEEEPCLDICGNDIREGLDEQCDGADDDACPGTCLPPGDLRQCKCEVGTKIPAVSEWGLIVVTLICMVMGTVILARKRGGAAPAA